MNAVVEGSLLGKAFGVSGFAAFGWLAVRCVAWLDVVNRQRFDPLCAPSRGVEWIGKVLGFMRHFFIPKLHNAHGVGALAFVDNHVLSDPEIALSHDPADRTPRWPPMMTTTERQKVTPTANYID